MSNRRVANDPDSKRPGGFSREVGLLRGSERVGMAVFSDVFLGVSVVLGAVGRVDFAVAALGFGLLLKSRALKSLSAHGPSERTLSFVPVSDGPVVSGDRVGFWRRSVRPMKASVGRNAPLPSAQRGPLKGAPDGALPPPLPGDSKTQEIVIGGRHWIADARAESLVSFTEIEPVRTFVDPPGRRPVVRRDA